MKRGGRKENKRKDLFVFMRMDLVESILRRGVVGIGAEYIEEFSLYLSGLFEVGTDCFDDVGNDTGIIKYR